MFDQAVSARESKAERKMRGALAERAKAGEDRQALLDAILAVAAEWAGQRTAFCRLVGQPADAAAGLALVEAELHTALGELEQTLAQATARSAWTRRATW